MNLKRKSLSIISLSHLCVQRREKGKMRVHKLQNIQNVLDYLTTKNKVRILISACGDMYVRTELNNGAQCK